MKDYIAQIISPAKNRQENFNLVREYLQKYILFILHTKKYLRELVFTGGTALRVLYGLQRFSEDLDFSLHAQARGCDFVKLLEALKRELEQSGYTIEAVYDEKATVNKAFIKFSGLLYAFGLSPLKQQKFSIKLEIDTNPPQGGETQVTLHNSVFMFHILHYDIPSLFTGKVNALLCRRYTKGRDYYDLLWYLTRFKDIKPNFVLLNNGMRQAQENPEEIHEQNWRFLLRRKIEQADMEIVINDIEPLLENKQELDIIRREVILDVLKEPV